MYVYPRIHVYTHKNKDISTHIHINPYTQALVHAQIRTYTRYMKGCPRDLLVKTLDHGIIVSEFELQTRYYVHFRTNTLGKGMNPLILPVMG